MLTWCGVTTYAPPPCGQVEVAFWCALAPLLPAPNNFIEERIWRSVGLLHLSGGPGSSDVGWVRTFNQPLEDHFTVVVWEQRGVGKSYPALDPTGTFTLDRIVADGVDLSRWLVARFGQPKIYLTGNSWGSTLGVLMVQRDPGLFYAYAGTGQMVSQRATDGVLYQQLLAYADRSGNAGLRDRLRALGLSGFFPAEYSLLDTWNEVRGFADMGGLLYPQLQNLDFRVTVPRLEVPVYFMQGRHEPGSPTSGSPSSRRRSSGSTCSPIPATTRKPRSRPGSTS